MSTVGKLPRRHKLAGLGAAWLGLWGAPAVAEPEADILLRSPSRLDALLHLLPSAASYNHLFEHVFQPSMFSLEENAGFSDVDPELLSLYGHSALWTEWRLEELNLSDPLFSGSAAFKVPFRFLSALELRHGESVRTQGSGGVAFMVAPRRDRPRRLAGATVTASGLGDIVPLAYPVMEAFSGIHSREREPPPPEDRRRFRERVQLHLMDEAQLQGAQVLRYAVEIDRGVRHYLDFPSADPSELGGFDETYTRVSSVFELAPRDRAFRVLGLLEYRARSHLYAERYYGAAETQSQETFGGLIGLRREDLRLGLTFKHYDHRANQPGFARELIDLDGEGLFPFEPAGTTQAFRVELADRFGPVYAEADLRALLFSPERALSVHPLSFDGAPYGTMEVRAQTAVTWVGQHRVGFTHAEAWGPLALGLDGHLAAFHAHPGAAQSLAFLDVGLEAELFWDRVPGFRPFLLVAKSPVPITTQLAELLNPARFSAEERLLDGTRLRTLGGAFTRLGGPLAATNVYTGALGFESALGKGWRFAGQGMVKAFDHTYRLGLDGPAERYGGMDRGVYVFRDGETRFVLEETPRDELPVYFAGHLQFQKVDPAEHFFLLSFSVLNSIGHPPPLNGPYGNDLGVVDYSSANPNAAVRSRANLDTDRAFVFRLAAGLRFWESLWGTITVAHRDGQPFGYYDYYRRGGQVATTFATTRGSPLKYTRPFTGPREDFMLSVDAELSYRFELGEGSALRLALLGANLLDFGNEIGELNHRPYRDARAALESELPRTVLFQVELLGP